MNPIVSNKNKLRWKFENVNELTDKGMESDRFKFRNIYWSIVVAAETENDIKYLSVYLNYDGDDNEKKNWICEVKRVCKVLNQNGIGDDFMSDEDVFIYNSDCFWGDSTGIEWSKLESDGYIKDNSIIVEIALDFKYYDFSKNIPNYTDIIINVKDTKFYVNKGLLCSKSEYFHNKFIIDNSDEKELMIKNVKAEDFLYFIASFCLFFEKVDEKNYEQLMKLADEYKTLQLHRNCEMFLISNKTLQLEKKIEYADRYNYHELMKSCIDSITTTEQIKKLRDSIEFKNLKDTNKLAIMTHLLNLVLSVK